MIPLFIHTCVCLSVRLSARRQFYINFFHRYVPACAASGFVFHQFIIYISYTLIMQRKKNTHIIRLQLVNFTSKTCDKLPRIGHWRKTPRGKIFKIFHTTRINIIHIFKQKRNIISPAFWSVQLITHNASQTIRPHYKVHDCYDIGVIFRTRSFRRQVWILKRH